MGLDLAWTDGGTTGVASLGPGGVLHIAEPQTFTNEGLTDAILALTGGAVPQVVAVDSPLVVPNQSGSRPAENALKHHRFAAGHVAVFSSNRRFFARYGGVRAERLVPYWQELGWGCSLVPGSSCWVVETYPRGILASAFPAHTALLYKGSVRLETKRSGLAALQQTLHGWVKARGWVVHGWPALEVAVPQKHNGADALADALDAVLCVLAAEAAGRSDTRLVFGTDWAQGCIVLPSGAV